MSRTFEQLERRCLFSAASITVDAMGILNIVGTDAADTVQISTASGTLSAKVNGQAFNLPASSINGISVAAGDDNDDVSIDAATTQPATLIGGAGDDTLAGGGGDTTLRGGAGSDSLVGSAGVVNTLDESDLTGNLTLGTSGPITESDSGDADVYSRNISRFVSGSGNDNLYVRDIPYVDGGAGNDKITMSDLSATGTVTLHGGGGNDTLAVTAHDQIAAIYGDAGDDRFLTTRDDNTSHDWHGGDGIDTLDFYAGTASNPMQALKVTLDDVANDGSSTEYAFPLGVYSDNAHSDIEKVITGQGPAYVSAQGLDHAVTIIGNNGNDTLIGGSGDDSIDGGAGNDKLYGNNGNDTLLGGNSNSTLVQRTSGDDYLEGGYGDDSLDGGLDNDTLVGEDGNDTLIAGGGDDQLDGGAGSNTLVTSATPSWYSFAGGVLIINLGEGNDNGMILQVGDKWVATFNGEQKSTPVSQVTNIVVNGNGGDDYVHFVSNYGRATLNGGDGNDSLIGGNLGDSISGGAGDDSILGEDGNDTLDGGDGNDYVGGGEGDNLIFGGTGNDRLSVQQAHGTNYLYGGDGSDTLEGGKSNDYLDGGAGDDSVTGDDGDDVLADDGGSNILIGGSGNNTIVNAPIPLPTSTGGTNTGGGNTTGGGTTTPVTPTWYTLKNGVLTINGAAKADNIALSYHSANGKLFVTFNGSVVQFVGSRVSSIVVNGNAGNDKIDASYANVATKIYGGAGSDLIYGSAFADRIYGGDDADYIYALGGNDIVYGEAGNDRLFGGAGLDHVDGGAGTNVLRGEDGKDTLTYRGGDNISGNKGDYLLLAPNLA